MINSKFEIRNSKFRPLGFTLIEVIVSISVMGLLVVGILSVFTYALKTVAENKSRTGAITLAEEHIELVRNLPYDSVGTVGGIPSGSLEPIRATALNNINYTITTHVIYVDDPFDGTVGGNPNDLLGSDYKKIRVAVNWTGQFGAKTYVTVTTLTPRGMETTGGGGTLSLLVFDANGAPVPQASVTVANPNVTPPISLTVETNDQGRYVLPGAPASINQYRISATKAGYSADFTCAIDAAGGKCDASEGNPTPTKPHVTVVAGELTETSLAIDRVATMVVNAIRQATPAEWGVNTGGGAFDQDIPAAAICPNGNSLFVWRDYRQNNNPRIYAQQYNPQQQPVWNPDLAVTAANNQNNPDVAVDGGCQIYAAWNDDRNGNQDIYLNKYSAAGTDAWGGAKKITTASQSADQITPKIIVNASSTFAYVVWQDLNADPGDLKAEKLDPDGNQLWAGGLAINTDPPGATQAAPVIALDPAGNLRAVWQDNRNGNLDIYGHAIAPTGAPVWSQERRLNAESLTAEQQNPALAVASDSSLVIAWDDQRNGNGDIYANRLDGNGNALWGTEVKVNSDTGAATQGDPTVAVQADGVIWIAWEDNRNGGNDIYLQKLATSGVKLLPSDIRVNANVSGEQENPELTMTVAGQPMIVWQDNGLGNYDIKAAVYTEDPQTIAVVPNFPFFLTGAKRIGENPVIPKYTASHITGGGGQVAIAGLEWDTYSFTPVGANIVRAEPNMPVALAPNTTLIVTLNLQ